MVRLCRVLSPLGNSISLFVWCGDQFREIGQPQIHFGLAPKMPPVTTKNFWSVRPTPYRREAIKEGHVYSDPFFGLSLELWVGHIIGNTPTSILMLMRAVCLGWKQLIDPEIERRHKLLGVPVWLV
jgi:hypothetical protein